MLNYSMNINHDRPQQKTSKQKNSRSKTCSATLTKSLLVNVFLKKKQTSVGVECFHYPD